MQRNLYYHLIQLATQMKKQEEKLKKLEKKYAELNQTMQELTEKPPVNIERIDYHFDQLKIERLEGTLNIGLNPSDLQNMDEFRIPTPFPNLQMVQNREFSNQLEQKILDFIENDLPNMIDDKKEELQLDLDDSYTNFVKEDIRKQLPGRIQYYFQKLSQENRNSTKEEQEQEIYYRIVSDIEQAVHTFFLQFHAKGDRGSQ